MTAHDRRRVVVTGMGAVTPLGTSVDALWSNLVAGRSGVQTIAGFDASGFQTTFGAEILAFDETRGPTGLDVRSLLNRKDLFGWVAAEDALRDAAFDTVVDPSETGVAIGTERRCPSLLHRIAAGAAYDDPLDHIRHSPLTLNAALASAKRLEGPHVAIAAACASSTYAIGMAYQKIRAGEVNMMLAGGCDSLIDPVMLTAFGRLGALSVRNDDPPRASRPFDLHRDGFVLGEGAGMVVLEDYEHARARGVRMHAEVLGFACSTNAYRMTDSPPDGRGLCLAMQGALDDAEIGVSDIDYINAHGTSTVQNDRSETAAIKRCLQSRAYDTPISSTKSMLGHLVCAGGAIEFIVCVLTTRHGIITPTINYEFPDHECDLDYVPNHSRVHDVRIAMSNSAGFGGVNASVLVARGDGHA